MRRMRWMPSRGSSTIGSRRSSAARRAAAPAALLPLVCAALLLLAAAASSQAIELSVAARDGVLAASLSFRWARADELINSLRKGLESRITFTTRLYEKRRPAFSFAGDRLLSQRTVARSAFWDFLDQVFVVEDG